MQPTNNTRPFAFSVGGVRLGEVIILLSLAIMAGFVMVSALAYPPNSVIYPFLIGTLLLLLVAIRLISLFFQRGQARQAESSGEDADDESPREDLPLRPMATYAAVIVALVFSLNFLWFPIPAFVAGVAILRLVFKSGWKSAILSAFLVSAISSVVFWGLGVPLPGPAV